MFGAVTENLFLGAKCIAAARAECFNAPKGHHGQGADWHGRRRARTYREALRREGIDLPAYNRALSVYLGHFPTMCHGAARRAVVEIIAADLKDRESWPVTSWLARQGPPYPWKRTSKRLAT